MNARAERFPLFDALRAIAALSVLVFHAAFIARIASTGSVVRPYTARLDVGVTIFFLISGFLLYRPFVRARLRERPAPATGPYAWRRFLRIVPAYWVALTVVTLWLSLPQVWSHIPLFYGFAQIYDAPYSGLGIGQAWTLCVEVTFYAFLPLWAAAVRLLPRRRMVAQELALLALLFLASMAYKVWALRHTSPISLSQAPWLQPLPNFLDQFAIGMALAVASVEVEARETVPRAVAFLRRYPTVPWLVSAVAFWAVCTQIGLHGEALVKSYTNRSFLERHLLYALVATGLIVPAIFAVPGRGLAGRVLANRALRWLGLVSYGIYLYHLAAIEKVDQWLGKPFDAPVGWRALVYLVLGGCIAVALAAASYYVVERPVLRLKRLVPDRGAAAARGEAVVEPAPVVPAAASSATAASTTSATSAGWRKRGTP